jgi:lipoyl synthase
LVSDFRGDLAAMDRIIASGADVIAHNLETVERLTKRVRDPRCGYRQSLSVLAHVKRTSPKTYTKSSLMVGLGETQEEMAEAMDDLRSAGVDILTIGQYLRPSQKHLPVEEFIHPTVFKAYEEMGLAKGFKFVPSGPLVRSSYKAGEKFIESLLRSEVGKA